MSSSKAKFAFFMLAGAMFITGIVYSVNAQPDAATTQKSQEINEVEGVPVLMLHLPEWKNVKATAVFATETNDLKPLLGERQIFDLMEFNGGTEAAAAPYDEGKLLIIEYMTPQSAAYADQRFLQRLAEAPEPTTVYKRIGNYSVFVFDAADPVAGNALADQVKYEKSVQWLGEDPFLINRFERYLALTGRDVALSTMIWIAGAAGIAISLGLICGFAFFQFRERKRGSQEAFSDAGGMTRLNLDDLSEPIK